ncbi:PREDICTED: uncharacterized protein LOC108798887, partial [Nanorana parkeri]|uniref:uncharacterized protein LOC108798887 n=1 Tax=Nanorana parkeri TaxID=125878 RepID=UPI0008544CB9
PPTSSPGCQYLFLVGGACLDREDVALEEMERRMERERVARCEMAALSQALAVLCACLALSDPGWLLLRVDGDELVYGASYIIHHGFNFTETGTHQLLHKTGLYILALMAVCCYINILLGSFAFMLDFLRVRSVGITVSTILHFITVVSSAASVALCSYLYVLLRDEVYFQVTKPPLNYVKMGESYYFAICTFLAAISATVLSCCSRKYRRDYETESPVSGTDVTTPLLQDSVSPDSPGEYG